MNKRRFCTKKGGKHFSHAQRKKRWQKVASALLCVALLCSSVGGDMGSIAAAAEESLDILESTVQAEVEPVEDGDTATDELSTENENPSIESEAVNDAQEEGTTATDESIEEETTATGEPLENGILTETGEDALEEEKPGDLTEESEGQEIQEESVETSSTQAASPEQVEAVYTLHLTHYFRFTVNGEDRNVRDDETIELTDSDFENGECDLNQFAYDIPQLAVSEATPISLEMFQDANEGGARILYNVNSDWMIIPVDMAEGEGTILREVFQGSLQDYEFIPAKILHVDVAYKYSSTGGLAGIDAADPAKIEALPVKNEEGEYEFEFSLPTIEGFQIVLNPAPLNKYLKNPPTGNETQEELLEAMDRGDFDADTVNNVLFYYQEVEGVQENPTYHNRYSTAYNTDWNLARTIELSGDDGYKAVAICGMPHEDEENHGANDLVEPKLKITLTEKQLEYAAINGLSITISYRRSVTGYTVRHWIPQNLCGLTVEEIHEKGLETKEEGSDKYVLWESEKAYGRVGALTRAKAKEGDNYALLEPQGITQQIIEENDTIVDVNYKAAEAYDIIFDSDYTYIPRQQVELGGFVNFEGANAPTRKGFVFEGWRYLKKDAEQDESGNYTDEDYENIPENAEGNPELEVSPDLISKKAKLHETGGVMVLHLYPIWKPNKTQITVVLWTEDLTGVDDVHARVDGGESDYYTKKYEDYKEAPVTHAPVKQSANINYSNVGSFSMMVDTDSFLIKDESTLQDAIQAAVTEKFTSKEKETSGIDASKFYHQHSFEILHESEGKMDYSTVTANADGKTTIYVYFTRNIYTLKFHYYGGANYSGGNYSDYCFAIQTNGYSYAGTDKILDSNGELIFDYSSGAGIPGYDYTYKYNTWVAAKNGAQNLMVPETIVIQAKYGADLREVWPVSLPEEVLSEGIKNDGNPVYNVEMCSWATTAGKYRDEAMDINGHHFDEATIMGLYATMDSYIIGNPESPEITHHLIAYWSLHQVSVYRLNHCFEVPGVTAESDGVIKHSLYNDSTALKDTLYLVPTTNEKIQKYGFTDLMKVSYTDGTIKYNDPNGTYFAVRGYEVDNEIKYYALGRQITTVSTNSIEKQNPSARAHMTRVNDNADHNSKHTDWEGMSWQGSVCGTKEEPYDLYFYYERDRYTITYMAPNSSTTTEESAIELGRIVLPYGTHITREEYAFNLFYRDSNQSLNEDGSVKYLWSYPTNLDGTIKPAISVCPDWNHDDSNAWRFKGWGLGPAGVNMQWEMQDETLTDPIPQAQATDDFYIGSDLLLYAIWIAPSYKVTFHLNGGVTEDRESIVVWIPANESIASTKAQIPHPVRKGYLLKGWYQADENGNSSNIPFDFEKVITRDQHVVAEWTAGTIAKYNYKVYYVTKDLHENDSNNSYEILWMNERGEILEDGGEPYYVLGKDIHTDVVYPAGTTLHLAAKGYEGYLAQQTNMSLVLESTAAPNNVVFMYEPQIVKKHTVKYIEAGTENTTEPKIVKAITVQADQTVTTPNAEIIQELTKKGYCVVNKTGDESYVEVPDYTSLTWIDENGTVQPVSTLVGDTIPEVVTFLVQPRTYTITYLNADGSPTAADAAINVLENPSQYTRKDSFTVKNPTQVQENGKVYLFSHWSLGADTVVMSATEEEGKYTNLQIEEGTVGNLTFVANWVVDAKGNLRVSKTVVGERTEEGKAFTFTITKEDGTKVVNASYTKGDALTVYTTDENGQFTLCDGESALFKEIGKCGETLVITETPDSEYPQLLPADNEPVKVTLSDVDSQADFVNKASNMLVIQKEWKAAELATTTEALEEDKKRNEALADKYMKSHKPVTISLRVTPVEEGTSTYSYPKADTEVTVLCDGVSERRVWKAGEQFQLGSGEMLLISDIPVNATYTVEESAASMNETTWEEIEYEIAGELKKVETLCQSQVQQGSITGILAEKPSAILINEVKTCTNPGIVHKHMTSSSSTVPTGAKLVYRLEQYNEATGSWLPATGIPYMIAQGDCRKGSSLESMISAESTDAGNMRDTVTGESGFIYLQKENGMEPLVLFPNIKPYVNLFDTDAIASVYVAGEPLYRIIEIPELSDSAWGTLVGYCSTAGEAQDTHLGDVFGGTVEKNVFVNSNAVEYLTLGKALSTGKASPEVFQFQIEHVISTDGYDENLCHVLSHTAAAFSNIETDSAGCNLDYEIFDSQSGAMVGIGNTGSKGIVTIKANQYAKIPVTAMSLWKVTELTPQSHVLDSITSSSVHAVQLNENSMLIDMWPVDVVKLKTTAECIKSDVKSGDILTTADFSVNVYYNDGSIKTLTNEEYSLDVTVVPEAEWFTQVITITATEETVICKVPVRIEQIQQSKAQNLNLVVPSNFVMQMMRKGFLLNQ